MTYFGFLLIFLGIPLLIISALNFVDRRKNRRMPIELTNWLPGVAIAAHALVAVAYTTPWDNYLVATGVWWYDPQLVTGITIGWVPIEEYTFFILQPVLAGLWLVYLARRLPFGSAISSNVPTKRWLSVGVVGVVWLAAAAILASGWQPGTYLGLILVWALLPIMFQLWFGADILWRHRYLIGVTIVTITLYLSAADALAIGSGTWTIDPGQSLQIYLGGVLPVEEFLFFLVTTVLLSFGMVLVMARQSQERLTPNMRNRLSRIIPQGNG